MNILYIGHFNEGSGWSHAAINNVLALNTVGQNVICRNIKLTNSNKLTNEKVIECLSKPIKDIDVCIQHVLPHHFVGTSMFKNIAYYDGEINTIKHLPWFYSLSLADSVWVACQTNKTNLDKDGLKNVEVIPHCFNLAKYDTEKTVEINTGTRGHFKFYTISDLNDRKNLESIIRCFHSEFKSYEPVELVLKLNQINVPANVTRNVIAEKINNIKQRLRIYQDINSYKNEIVICDYLSSENIMNLHKSCDCFILPSHGEGFSMPSFEAMCYGNTPICSNDGGPKDFIDQHNKDTGYLVDGVYDICDSSNAAFKDINTGLEEWFHPSESDIKNAMRFYYENKTKINRESGKIAAEKFSFENIGNLMLEKINE